MPCKFSSIFTLFWSRPAAHRALHSRLVHFRCRTAWTGAQRPSPRPPLPPRRPLEAWQLGLSSPRACRQAPLMALQRRVQPAATARLPSRLTCWPYVLVHRPPQPPAPDPRPARPAPLVHRPPGAAQPAAAPASRQSATVPNGIDRVGLAQVCPFPLNPSPLRATARSKLLLVHLRPL